ncbi:class I SAM-dependent methyltransferase [Paraburkholderia fungorum]|uniref:class I SAM-dependent methyltransferase n=1 Tax=Paraburkholderia fungorum TaxID=134537 RepID=UPI0033133ED8
MDSKEHWEAIYRTTVADTVSWYRPHLEISLRLICDVTPDLSAAIIDVGGGQSTFADDILARGYQDLTVLDMSAVALNATKKRLGSIAEQITWFESDITAVDLPEHRYDVWHDRAVFHFLTEPSQRYAYIYALTRALKPGGCIVLATFGPRGPDRCSGLEVKRYDAEQLSSELGTGFKLVTSLIEDHQTPAGSCQQFLYCCFRKR